MAGVKRKMHDASLTSPLLTSIKNEEPQAKPHDVSFLELFEVKSPIDFVLIFFGFIAAIITGASIPAFNVLMGRLINDINDKDSGFGSSISTLIHALIALAFINLVSGTVQIYCWSCNGERQASRLREAYVRSILRQEIGWFDNCGASELSTRVSELCGQVQDGIGRKFGDMEQYFVQVVASFAASFYLSWELTVVLIGAVPFIGLAGWFMIEAVTAAQNASADQYAAAGGVATEALSSIRTVTALNAQPLFIKKYRRFLLDAMKVGIQKGRKVGLGNGILFCVCFLTYSLGFWYGARLVARDMDHQCTSRCATGGKIISVFFCVIMGSVGVGQMAPPMNAFFSAKAAAGQMIALIKRKPEIDGLSEEGIVPHGGDMQGFVQLKNVHFSYPSRPNNAVCIDYSLEINRGELVALCGTSGCGKSTIVNLLLRFYDPQKGSVLIDGIDSRELNLRWLRSRCGYVGQEPVLFSGTIAENISYGLDRDVVGGPATADEVMARVKEAARLSYAHEFIEAFPDGYDTRVGTNGVALSGGQKQRIAIARALVKRPAILLLDEATSALDAASEQMVQQSIDALQQSRSQTTLVIAHRLSTIRNADKIALISQGKVAELGSHDELLAQNGLYADLVRLQMSNSDGQTHKECNYDFVDKDSSVQERHSGLDLRSISSESGARRSLVSQSEVIFSGLRNASRSISFADEPNMSRLVSVTSKPSEAEEEDISPEERRKLNQRVWALIMKNPFWLMVGLVGAATFGAVFPVWGMILAKAENMFFYEDTEKMRHKATVQAIYFAGLGLTSLVSCTLQYWGVAQVGERLSARMRSDLFEAYMRRGISFFDEEVNSAGELCTRLSDDSRIVHKAGGEALAKQLQAAFTLLVGCIIGFTASWRIALVVIACFPANIAASAVQMQALSGQQYDTSPDDDSQNGLLGTVFTNMRTVNAFSMQFMMSEKYASMTRGVSNTRMRRSFMAGIGFGASNMSLFLTYTLLFWYGQHLMNKDQVTFQNMMISIFSLMLGALGLGQAMIDMTDQSEGLAAARRIFRAVDAAACDSYDSLSTKGERPLQPCKGNIEIKNMSFGYPSRASVEVCKLFNVSISAGEVVAIVGPSGSGKSTIMSLLLRFYDPTEGQITIDGKKISDLNIRWIRSQVGYVGQEPVLFSGSIADNVMMGRADMDEYEFPTFEEVLAGFEEEFAESSTAGVENYSLDVTYLPPHMYKGGAGICAIDEESQLESHAYGVADDVYNACVSSNAHSFITTFADRYDTDVGEKSVMISGGQKQRIALARALVKRPAILLLDEATSALDTASEQMVQQSIDDLQQSRAQTTLVIAHRLSTIRNADRILVVDAGVVVQEGKHDVLVATSGLYSTLWHKQQGTLST